jgi:hypothetical protein
MLKTVIPRIFPVGKIIGESSIANSQQTFCVLYDGRKNTPRFLPLDA